MAAPVIDEVEFPQRIAVGAQGGPTYRTEIVTSSGGSETRNQVWSVPLYRFNVATGLKTNDDLQTLIGFYRLRKGRARGFRFRDWSDYQSGPPSNPTAQQWAGDGDGSTKTFQLVKRYTDGLLTEVRNIYKPVNDSTLLVYLNSTLQTSGYTLDPTTGLLTFATAPGAGVHVWVAYTFDVPCRFDSDVMQAKLNEATGQWDNIVIVELRN
jgi:uncharacterized protein (TIGR02217 family)